MTDEHEDRAEKLRKLLALEISRIIEDLELRRDVLVELWGRTRDRGMFIDTVFSRWATLGFPDLLDLETDQVAAVDTFYRELHDLRFYFRFTEDMPAHLLDTYDLALRRLGAYGEHALEQLGGAPERPFIEFPEDEDEAPAASSDAPDEGGAS